MSTYCAMRDDVDIVCINCRCSYEYLLGNEKWRRDSEYILSMRDDVAVVNARL